MYGLKFDFLHLRGKRSRDFENRVLKRIIGLKKEEMARDCSELCHEELQHITRVGVISRVRYVELAENTKNL